MSDSSGEHGVQSCIISASSMDAAAARARELAAAVLCSAEGKRPCGQCRSCRKIQRGVHPDVITVDLEKDDKGKTKKEITVEQVRAVTADAYVMPNEAERKVYIIENADRMNIPAQNAALKFIEEPPGGAAVFLCVVNIATLLPTVRSRCTRIKCANTASEENEETVALALEYLSAVASSGSVLCSFCFANEGMDGSAALAFIECTRNVIADMLAFRRENVGLARGQLLYLAGLMDKCTEYLKVNTSVKHIFGLLAVASAG